MFGPRLNKVFASKAHALWWSAMVLITAYCVAAEPPAQMPVKTPQTAALADKGGASGDPWAGMKDVAKKREEMLP